jgi:chromosome segregation ATPase
MAITQRAIAVPKTETEVAVLQVQVEHIKGDIGEIKSDIKDLTVCIEKNNTDTHSLLKEMKEASATAHKKMDEKISTLEKWRWMMMGAGIVLGTMGYETVAKLLK